MKANIYYQNRTLKRQEKSPERKNNETDLSSLPDPKFKKEVIKILKELRKAINRNADHCNKELETIKMSQLKLENPFAEMKAEQKAINSKLDNAEEWISDLAERIMEITQSESRQKDKWKKMKATYETYGII